MQEVYDAAMGGFETQMDEAEIVEGKYKARNGEVAVQFLNAALNAAKEKSGLKQHKDKVTKTPSGPVTNNVILTHEALLDMINDAKAPSANTLEGEYETKEEE